MKQIFRIFAIAAVALSAAACQNDINDTVAPEGEGVSIRVTIADQTRVALGDFEEGKGYKLTFEEGDQLYVASGWSAEGGFYFTYSATDGDEHIFTCTTEGVSAIVGTTRTIAYLGGKKEADGAYKFYPNTAAESVDGALMVADTDNFGTGTLSFRVAPILKFKSNDPVTITADKQIFRDGSSKNSYTTKTTGDWVYVPTNADSDATLTFSIYGQEVGTTTIAINGYESKIFNFGEIKAPEVEKDSANITIDGNFADWNDVKINVATLPADATESTSLKLMKSYVDASNIYVYVELEPAAVMHMGVLLDLDNNPSTGDSYWVYGSNTKSEVWVENYCVFNDGEAIPFAWGNFNIYDGGWVTASASISAVEPITIGENLAALEIAIPREGLNEMITTPYIAVGTYTLNSWSKSGILPYSGNSLIIPVN